MKMMIVILGDQDAEQVLQSLVENDYRATRISSTGVFLRRGNTTILIGLDEDRVDQAIELIREHTTVPDDPDRRRATLFVLPVAHYEQL